MAFATFASAFSIWWCLTGCGAASTVEIREVIVGDSAQVPTVQQAVHIGAVVTLDVFNTTPLGSAGRSLARGYQLCVDAANRRGGVLVDGMRTPLILTMVDDASAAQMVEDATEFVSRTRGIKLMLGPYGSELTKTAAQLASSNGATMVAPACSVKQYIETWPRVYGVLPGADTLLGSIMRTLAERGAKTVATIKEDSVFSRNVCGAMNSIAPELGLEWLDDLTVEQHADDHAIEMATQKVQGKNPDVLIGCVYHRVCHQLIRSSEALGFNPKAIVLTACPVEPDFLDHVGDAGLFTIGLVPEISWPVGAFEQIAAVFPQVSTPSQTGTVGAGFVACDFLVRAIEAAGTSDPVLVADALGNMSDGTRAYFDQSRMGIAPVVGAQLMPLGRLVAVSGQTSGTSPIVYPRPTWTELRCLDRRAELSAYGVTAGNSTCGLCLRKGVSDFNAYGEVRICRQCELGRFRTDAPSGSAEGGAVLPVECSPCPPGKAGVVSDGEMVCEDCLQGTFQRQSGSSTCELCPPGKFTEYISATECHLCQDFPSINDQVAYAQGSGNSYCLSCPEGGRCDQDPDTGLLTSVTNHDGHFAVETEEGPRMVPCLHGEGKACLANGRCYADPNTGEIAMEGPMCGVCAKGFAKRSDVGLCSKCPSVFISLLGCLLNFAIINVVIYLAYVSFVFTNFQKPRYLRVVVVKQVLNHIHLEQIVESAGLTGQGAPMLQNVLRELVSAASRFTGYSPLGFAAQSQECLAQLILPTISYYKITVVAGALAAPLWVLGTTLHFQLLRLCRRRFGKTEPKISRLREIIMVSLFILHPRLSATTLATFQCKYFDVPRRVLDTRRVCDVWIIDGVNMLMSMCGLMFFSLGFPLFVFLLLRGYKISGMLSKPTVLQSYGFLYAGFRAPAYYTESIHMVRRVLFQLVSVLPEIVTPDMTKHVGAQSACMLVLAVLFKALHDLVKPYDNRGYFLLHKIEGASLAAILASTLLNTWMSATYDELVEKEGWALFARDYVFSAIVFLLHCRVCALAAWGLAGKKKSKSVCLSGGAVEVYDAFWHFRHLSFDAAKLFQSVFMDFCDLHVEKPGAIVSYEGLVAALQKITVHAWYTDVRWKNADFLTRTMFEMTQRLEVADVNASFKKQILKFLTKAEETLRFLRKEMFGTETEHSTGAKSYATDNVETLQRFTHENVIGAATCVRGRHGEYTVEQLYESTLALGAALVDLAVPPGTGTGGTTSFFAGSFAAPAIPHRGAVPPDLQQLREDLSQEKRELRCLFQTFPGLMQAAKAMDIRDIGGADQPSGEAAHRSYPWESESSARWNWAFAVLTPDLARSDDTTCEFVSEATATSSPRRVGASHSHGEYVSEVTAAFSLRRVVSEATATSSPRRVGASHSHGEHASEATATVSPHRACAWLQKSSVCLLRERNPKRGRE